MIRAGLRSVTKRTSVAVALFLGAAAGWTRADDAVSFNRDIRPILSNNCFQCHGPDEKVRKADLRLDTEAGALADLGGHAAIIKGKPTESELIRRVIAEPNKIMPPRKTGKKLTAHEIDLLKRWIEQ